MAIYSGTLRLIGEYDHKGNISVIEIGDRTIKRVVIGSGLSTYLKRAIGEQVTLIGIPSPTFLRRFVFLLDVKGKRYHDPIMVASSFVIIFLSETVLSILAFPSIAGWFLGLTQVVLYSFGVVQTPKS